MFKKLFAILLALLMFCSCGAEKSEPARTGRPIENFHEENEYEEKWGLVLSLKNIDQKGLTVVFNQSGGNATGELGTGDYFSLEINDNGEWKKVPMIEHPEGVAVCFNDILLSVFPESETEVETNWEFYYGELPCGIYRIEKEVMDFRGTGDYEQVKFYAEFVLE